MLDVLVLVAGGLLAVLALPSELFPNGLPLLGLVQLVPVFWFVAPRSPGRAALGGVAWALIVTFGSEGWLFGFHPLAFPLVSIFQVPLYAGMFAWTSWLSRTRPSWSPWLPAAAWCGFEFLRLQGFLAYPYHSAASSLWSWPLAFQTADVVGTAGLTFLIALGCAWIASVALERFKIPARRWRDLVLIALLWALNLGYGIMKLSETDQGSLWRVALIQQSQDPWKGGASAYAAGLESLISLSRQAEVGHPDLIVWSETAFVPSVDYHTRYHENPDSLRLVRRLEDFLQKSATPYLIGNDHREKGGQDGKKDYNAVLAWDGAWRGRYEKQRLVPFTESFPFRDQLPWVYDRLIEADTHFWEPGVNQIPLVIRSVRVGTPVCFEDAFPEVSRSFALAGARALVNLTNDAWAPGTACRMQHLSLAVFRAVETRLPLVRAGNDGATVAISRRGEVLGLLPIGPAAVLQTQVRLGDGTVTLYTLWGDWFAIGLLVLALVLTPWWSRRATVVDKGR